MANIMEANTMADEFSVPKYEYTMNRLTRGL